MEKAGKILIWVIAVFGAVGAGVYLFQSLKARKAAAADDAEG